MKKQYNTPEIEISVLRNANIVTLSGGDGPKPGVGDANRRGQTNWDDDDE